MRAIIAVLVLICLSRADAARAQAPLDLGTPEAAFSGGPIRLSKSAASVLRAHYMGDKVPLIPQPFRGRLDIALAAKDWPKVETVKKELIAARGIVTALAWEQSRFVATGGVGVAELHARDIAATNSSGVAETAAMLWLYAAAVTMTDGHKCANAEAKDAHLETLRGPEFDGVIRVVRGLTEDRLVAMRDLAIRLESALAIERTDDTICRVGTEKPAVKPDAAWRADAAKTRAGLSKDLTAFAVLMRPKPVTAPPPAAISEPPPAAVSEPARDDAPASQ